MDFQKKSPTGISPKLHPNLLHPLLVEPHVLLLVFERLHQAAAKLLRCLRKFEQSQCHQLQGEQLVVGKKVQDQPAFFFAVEVPHIAEAELLTMVPLVQPQAGRAARRIGGRNPRPGRVVLVAIEGNELVFPARAE